MIIIALGAGDVVGQIVDRLQAWSAAGLLTPVVVAQSPDGASTDDALTLTYLSGGTSVNWSLDDMLGRLTSPPVLIRVSTVSGVPPQATLANSSSSAVLHAIGKVLDRLNDMPRLWAIFGDRPDATFPDLQFNEWQNRVIFAAEDRRSPEVSVAALNPANFPGHVAAGIAGLCSLWLVQGGDGEGGAARWLLASNQGGMAEMVWMARQFTRIIEFPELLGQLVDGIALDPKAYPNPNQDAFERVELGERLGPLAAAFVEHFPELQLGRPDLLPPDAEEVIGLVEKAKRLFRYVIDQVALRPAQIADQMIGGFYDRTARLLEGKYPEAGVRVIRWKEIAAGTQPDHSAASTLAAASPVLNEGNLAGVWSPFIQASVSLLDGSDGPGREIFGDQLFLTTQHRQLIALSPAEVARDPWAQVPVHSVVVKPEQGLRAPQSISTTAPSADPAVSSSPQAPPASTPLPPPPSASPQGGTLPPPPPVGAQAGTLPPPPLAVPTSGTVLPPPPMPAAAAGSPPSAPPTGGGVGEASSEPLPPAIPLAASEPSVTVRIPTPPPAPDITTASASSGEAVSEHVVDVEDDDLSFTGRVRSLIAAENAKASDAIEKIDASRADEPPVGPKVLAEQAAAERAKISRRTRRSVRSTLALIVLALAGTIYFGFFASHGHALVASLIVVAILVLSPVFLVLAALRGWRFQTRTIEEARKQAVESVNQVIAEAHLRVADVRLSRRLRELDDWRETIGMLIHHPLAFPTAAQVDRGTTNDLRLPSSVMQGHSVTERGAVESLQRRFVTSLYHQGWLMERYGELSAMAVPEILDSSSPEADQTLRAIEGDTSLDPQSPRRKLKAIIERELKNQSAAPIFKRLGNFLEGKALNELASRVRVGVAGGETVDLSVDEFLNLDALPHGALLPSHWEVGGPSERGTIVDVRVDGAHEHAGVPMQSAEGIAVPRVVVTRLDRTDKIAPDRLIVVNPHAE